MIYNRLCMLRVLAMQAVRKRSGFETVQSLNESGCRPHGFESDLSDAGDKMLHVAAGVTIPRYAETQSKRRCLQATAILQVEIQLAVATEALTVEFN